MRTVIVTGGIGSGKSAVCALLRKRGIPVYDSDSRVKELYKSRRSLVPRLEKALGCPLRQADGTLDKARLSALIFSDEGARETLESIVYPILLKDFQRWRSRQEAPFVVLVDAPRELRIRRVMARDGVSREQVQRRLEAQDLPLEKVNVTLSNSGSVEELQQAVDRVFFDKNSYLYKLLED